MRRFTSKPSSSLTSPSSSLTASALKTGYLTKMGEKVKSWKKRFFLLNTSGIYYYVDAGSVGKKAKGEVAMADIVAALPLPSSSAKFSHGLVIRTIARDYYCNADTDEDRDDWVRSINRAGGMLCDDDDVAKRQAAVRARATTTTAAASAAFSSSSSIDLLFFEGGKVEEELLWRAAQVLAATGGSGGGGGGGGSGVGVGSVRRHSRSRKHSPSITSMNNNNSTTTTTTTNNNNNNVDFTGYGDVEVLKEQIDKRTSSSSPSSSSTTKSNSGKRSRKTSLLKVKDKSEECSGCGMVVEEAVAVRLGGGRCSHPHCLRCSYCAIDVNDNNTNNTSTNIKYIINPNDQLIRCKVHEAVEAVACGACRRPLAPTAAALHLAATATAFPSLENWWKKEIIESNNNNNNIQPLHASNECLCCSHCNRRLASAFARGDLLYYSNPLLCEECAILS